MNDNDLIRRGDALALPPYDGDGDPAGQWDHHVFVRRDAIAALHAVTPAPDAAAIREARGKLRDLMCLPDGADLAIARKWAAEALAALTQKDRTDG